MAAKKLRKVVLDTNIIIELIRGNQAFIDEVDSIGFESLYIPKIVTLEILYGMLKKEERQTKELLRKFNTLIPDKEIMRVSEELMINNLGKRPQLPDCIIASTCLVYNCELFTLNRKDFDYLGVKLYKPIRTLIPSEE